VINYYIALFKCNPFLVCSVMPKMLHVSECDSNDHEQDSVVWINEVFVYEHRTAYSSFL